MNIHKGNLAIGQRIHSILYGGRDGIVYAIHGNQRPGSIENLMGGAIVMGGNAYFDIVFSDGTLSKRLPEAIIHGVQWRIYEEIATAEEIIKALEFVEIKTVEREKIAKRNAELREQERERLKREYSYLIQKPEGGGKGAAQNIRIELKKNWPKIKFSVKSKYSSVDVSWTDGPTEAQVDDIIQKYKAGSFNGMEDIYEYSEDAFNDVFGSAQYIFGHRHYSDALFNRAFTMLKTRYSGNIDKDLVVSNEDWKNGKLWSIGMNTGGNHTRDNLNHYMNSITRLLPEEGYENTPLTISPAGAEKFKVRYYDYSYGNWVDIEMLTMDDCLKHIENSFWDRI